MAAGTVGDGTDCGKDGWTACKLDGVPPELTVSEADPLLPPVLAEIVAPPEATAVTRPEPDTVAAAVLELDHVRDCEDSVLPDASRTTAEA